MCLYNSEKQVGYGMANLKISFPMPISPRFYRENTYGFIYSGRNEFCTNFG